MAGLASFHLSFILIAAALTIAAAISDWRSLRIPNWIPLALLALFPLYVLSGQSIDWTQHAGVFVLLLLIGIAMFAGHLAGAGDIKLLAVCALWAGPHLLGVLLVVTGLSGGVLALVYGILARRKLRARAALEGRGEENLHLVETIGRVAIPYGIAIAAGGLACFGMMIGALR